MFGILLVAIGTLTCEIGSAIGKVTLASHERRVYPLAVITNAVGGVLLLFAALTLPPNLFGTGVPGGLVFSLASLPFLLTRVVLEIIQVQVTLLAIARADRSTFGFLRTITLPLLLIVDLALGYAVPEARLWGVLAIIVGLLFLFLNHGITRKGSLLTLFGAVNAVITISIFKYDITHYNSVAVEQGLVILAIVIYFWILSRRTRQYPMRLLRERRYWSQFALATVDTAAMSFAYLFAAASVITAARRALAVLWAIGSGELYFHERHIVIKLIAFAFVAGGIALLLV